MGFKGLVKHRDIFTFARVQFIDGSNFKWNDYTLKTNRGPRKAI
jgi:hypothetical protein